MNVSCLQGYLTTTYDDLVAVFGQPGLGPNDDDDGKVTCEWTLMLDGQECRIYDWKRGNTPMRRYEWHIGGYNKRAVTLVENAFRQRRRAA
jgi:hypothetical protein